MFRNSCDKLVVRRPGGGVLGSGECGTVDTDKYYTLYVTGCSSSLLEKSNHSEPENCEL